MTDVVVTAVARPLSCGKGVELLAELVSARFRPDPIAP